MDSELLFLLIIILTVVINIIKAVKKKKAQSLQVPKQESVDTTQSDDWKKMLQDLLGESAPQPKPVTVKTKDELESLETLEPLGGYITDTLPYNFDEPEYTRSTIEDEVFDVKPAVEAVTDPKFSRDTAIVTSAHETLRDFDIRKAVIYSTILDRPYN